MNLVNKEYHKRARILLESWQDRGVFPDTFEAPSDETLAAMVDHAILRPDASISAVNTICKEARDYKFASVSVNPVHVERCVATYGDDITVCAAVGFPLGANHSNIKVAETGLAVEQGAKEIGMVINVGL